MLARCDREQSFLHDEQQILTLALLVPTDQFVIRLFDNDVQFLSCFDRKLFVGPLLISECRDNGHLLQHLDLPLILKSIRNDPISIKNYTVTLKWIRPPAALCNLTPAYHPRCVTSLIWKDKCSRIINISKEKGGRPTLNFFLNSFSSFSIFFCFFGSTSSALVLPLKFGRLAYKTIK